MKRFGNRELATLRDSVRQGISGNWPGAGRALAKALPPSSAANVGAVRWEEWLSSGKDTFGCAADR